ncbi:MAG: pantoate--beta-alanine ligase [Chitinophagaceae bacterium]|nr:pantoate--beta-alanine ligase [Chitinophagaceae bacterium]
MILFKKGDELKKYLIKKTAEGISIGFVPTMGALHEGHLSLVRAAKERNRLVVCSIFVNPSQFNDPQDYLQYPKTIDQDIFLLEKSACDILFLPEVQEIYPQNYTPLHYELGSLETLLEGKYRPGHFQGVCQVVDRLLAIVMPTILFLGQKDYQQCMVIERLIRLKQYAIQLYIVPTMRETSGLAMSSRNLRLTEQDRAKAAAIYTGLKHIKSQLQPGNIESLCNQVTADLLEIGFDKIDYISIANAKTLEPIDVWDGETALVVLAAAFLSGVRLIDNIPLT